MPFFNICGEIEFNSDFLINFYIYYNFKTFFISNYLHIKIKQNLS